MNGLEVRLDIDGTVLWISQLGLIALLSSNDLIYFERSYKRFTMYSQRTIRNVTDFLTIGMFPYVIDSNGPSS